MERTFDLTWVEEPARRWDYRGLKKVSDSIRAAVATGENLDDISDYTPLIANGGVDVLNLGARAAGITGALKVAALAYAFEVPVSVMNSPGNIMGHFAACLPNHIMIEVLDAGRDAFLHTEHHVEDGWVVMSEAPGLGISYDVEELEEAGGHFDPSDTGPLFSSRRRGAGLYQVGPGEAG
jgi:L-alanine-DL-glutamate epimerase-like enolase superfamily enzyme